MTLFEHMAKQHYDILLSRGVDEREAALKIAEKIMDILNALGARNKEQTLRLAKIRASYLAKGMAREAVHAD